jgi:predicted dehydrogenase
MSYGLTHENVVAEIAPPRLPYLPRDPANKLGIGIIGCGGISEYHCAAYQRAGYPVRLLCDHTRHKAETRARLFPSARVVDDWRDLLASPEVQVVDITTHPRERAALIPGSDRCR